MIADNEVIAGDALKIINYINANPGQNEGESSGALDSVVSNLPADQISLLAIDIGEQATRRRRQM